MIEASVGDLSPIVTGLVYCSVIDGCQRGARAAPGKRVDRCHVTQWCEQQPGLVPFTGIVPDPSRRAHAAARRLGGCAGESRLAGERFERRSNDVERQARPRIASGELLRLQGELDQRRVRPTATPAGAAYEPQPGLALLRLAQGRIDVASTAIAQVAAGVTDWVEQARYLPALVEIALAAGDIDGAAERLRRARGDRLTARERDAARPGCAGAWRRRAGDG